MGLLALLGALGGAATATAQAPAPAGLEDTRDARTPQPIVVSRDGAASRPAPSVLSRNRIPPASPPPSTPTPATRLPTAASIAPAASSASDGPPRYRISVGGKCMVARLHGRHGERTVLMQPDGQLGFPSMLVPTSEPFVPVTADALRQRLEKDPYKGFAVLTTPHYLVFYQSRLAFAQDSAKLLEDLYRGLIEFCHRHEVPVHESEFPLVAVIYATERDFRAHKQVDPDVQACYEIYTNRIFFYEQSDRDRSEPKLQALRKPQTVAHEGAHQILANIGVQPRLSEWPLWLIEGFAEYCATPTRTKKGLAYDRLGAINALHMVTLRELDDPLRSDPLDEVGRARPGPRPSRLLDSEALIAKTRLTPTDYSQSWALTYYLTQRRKDEFVRYLRAMSQVPPLEPRTPESHLAEFRRYFSDDPAKLDRKVEDFFQKVSQKGNFPVFPYYAVIFEQPLGDGMVRRKAWVSQSPQMIQRLVEQTVSPHGGPFTWDFYAFPTKARAELAAETWIRGY